MQAEDPPLCVTVKVCPPAVIFPVRAVVPVLPRTLNATVPLPDPFVPPVSVIHGTELVAVQSHLAPAVTVNEPVPPPSATVRDAGTSAYKQETDAPACVTDTTWPAAMIVAARDVVAVLTATLNVMVPLPVPLVGPTTVSQGAVLNVLHAQLAPVVMVNESVPPAAGTDCEVGFTL
jgi:hypothetical protein